MRDLPIGIVTFLFTDVEGSTRLLDHLGRRYANVIDRHNAILRSAIAAADGHEVSTEGDSFFVVFPTPSSAVRAAVQAQRELAAVPWPQGVAVRVRMGLHTGEAIIGGDNYLGMDVNRAARIASAAHGGQVLASDATRTLAERSLPPSTDLRDLGLHRLKDLAQPERLYQLVIEGLEQDFPPPRTLDARPNNLPAQLTRFIGRRDEIAVIRRLLASNRLVTLTGPGGTGKTRLALEVAAEAMKAFGDGAFFVDLSHVIDPELVPATIAEAVLAREEPGRRTIDTLMDHLEGKELLLVLDNFEQVVHGAATVLDPLVRAAPRLKVLVTSRVPLHIYGEQECPVPPLGLPDPEELPDLNSLARYEGVALFAERAAAVRPDFSLTQENARAVVEITARLDGLPLAIELAASRVKLLSPERLLARLEQRLPLLTSTHRNVPERQRTLRRTIEWSYELLDPSAKRMFSRLAVFAGGADLEAVEGVTNPEGELGLDTLDGLASLVDYNLVRRDDAESRFRMLETVREYGLERLSQWGEELLIRRRHLEHWIEVTEQASDSLASAEQVPMMQRLERDHDNYRSALSWALQSGEAELGLRLATSLGEFWRLGSHVREGVRWLGDLLAMPEAPENSLSRARALSTAADLAPWMGATEAHLQFAEDAVAAYRQVADPHGISEALGTLGWAQLHVGRLSDARANLEEARQLNISEGQRHQAANCNLALGALAQVEGQASQAQQHFENALETFEQLGDPYWGAFTELLLGQVDTSEGDAEAAESRLRSSLTASHRHDFLLLATSVLYAFADLALLRGQYTRALRLAGASDALREPLGDKSPIEKASVKDVRGAARRVVDEAAADALYEEGRAMGLEDAVAYAQQDET